MKTEEKKSWLAHATNEQLIDQFANFSRCNYDAFNYADRLGITVDEIFENYELAKAELLLRLTAVK